MLLLLLLLLLELPPAVVAAGASSSSSSSRAAGRAVQRRGRVLVGPHSGLARLTERHQLADGLGAVGAWMMMQDVR